MPKTQYFYKIKVNITLRKSNVSNEKVRHVFLLPGKESYMGWVVVDQNNNIVSQIFNTHEEALRFKKQMNLQFINSHKIMLKEINEWN